MQEPFGSASGMTRSRNRSARNNRAITGVGLVPLSGRRKGMELAAVVSVQPHVGRNKVARMVTVNETWEPHEPASFFDTDVDVKKIHPNILARSKDEIL